MIQTEVLQGFSKLADKVAVHQQQKMLIDCFINFTSEAENKVAQEIFSFIESAIDEKIQRESAEGFKEMILEKAKEQGIVYMVDMVKLIKQESNMGLRDAVTLAKNLGFSRSRLNFS